MNWMWGYDETVVIVAETIRTVLRLLREYPEFRFSQSQGSVYRIVEEYEPELLDEIRRYVSEGRWELTATQWTETDMNLPSAESLLRHSLYTVRYLQELFGIDRDALRVAFMPDTFGHSAATPEILAEAGVRYVYHCRGFTGPVLTRWTAASGRSVLAYREPRWYNERVEPTLFSHLAQVAHEHNASHALSVYGVGDHGGGPTRRDIEMIGEMRRWPLAPTIRFGSYHEFFRTIESDADIPAIEGERNRIFTGCYSSQARIKSGNRLGERSLFVSETLGSFVGTLSPQRMHGPWSSLLFSQFHDILPGSGVPATRDYTLGLYQVLYARTQTETNRALRTLAAQVAPAAARRVAQVRSELEGARRTTARDEDYRARFAGDEAEGAGVGFAVAAGRASATGRWGGPVRPFLVVNPLARKRRAAVELVLWDYQNTPVEVVDESGTLIPSQVIRSGEDRYWSHDFVVVLAVPELEAWEYRTLFVRPVAAREPSSSYHPYGVDNWLVERSPELVLDNGKLRIELDRERLAINSLVDLETGTELIGGDGACFSLGFEEPGHMSAWYTHRVRSREAIGPGGRVRRVVNEPDAVRSWIELELPFSARGLHPEQGGSTIHLRIELDRESTLVRLVAAVAFREVASRDLGIPVLSLEVPTRFSVQQALRDTPVGFLTDSPDGVPVAVQSGITAIGKEARLTVIGRDSQSCAATRGSVSAILLRGSDSPDPAPEVGDHAFTLYLGRHDLAGDHGARDVLVEPQVISIERPEAGASAHGATDSAAHARSTGALREALANVRTDGVDLLAVKPAESVADAFVLRWAANADRSGHAEIEFARTCARTTLVDAIEQPLAPAGSDHARASLEAGSLLIDVPAGRVASVLVEFAS
jgi:alpha-mannosidase